MFCCPGQRNGVLETILVSFMRYKLLTFTTLYSQLRHMTHKLNIYIFVPCVLWVSACVAEFYSLFTCIGDMPGVKVEKSCIAFLLQHTHTQFLKEKISHKNKSWIRYVEGRTYQFCPFLIDGGAAGGRQLGYGILDRWYKFGMAAPQSLRT